MIVHMRDRGQGLSILNRSLINKLSDKKLLVEMSLSANPIKEVALPWLNSRVLQSEESSRLTDEPVVGCDCMENLNLYT
jgi:hypothetical protein